MITIEKTYRIKRRNKFLKWLIYRWFILTWPLFLTCLIITLVLVL
jgi:hypothetical protein